MSSFFIFFFLIVKSADTNIVAEKNPDMAIIIINGSTSGSVAIYIMGRNNI